METVKERLHSFDARDITAKGPIGQELRASTFYLEQVTSNKLSKDIKMTL